MRGWSGGGARCTHISYAIINTGFIPQKKNRPNAVVFCRRVRACECANALRGSICVCARVCVCGGSTCAPRHWTIWAEDEKDEKEDDALRSLAWLVQPRKAEKDDSSSELSTMACDISIDGWSSSS